ncbi:hypothetical protein Glove_296g25 [Diversispora epigaea]|uniref:triacylglycerol lipase n=1 Tax=Diversispora epigaea TaxID=1348612 RepID=A0A397I373_9GLOM|nr:hypothetical protein Glove_296g25 [Diversispora epigaea]
MNTFSIKRFSILLFLISFLTTFNIIWTREEQTEQQAKHVEKNSSKRYSYKSTGDPKTFTLKHVYHHCTSKYPNLIRRKDINETSLRAQELKTGASFTYTLKGIKGKKMTPTKYTIDEYRQKSKNEQITLNMDWKTAEEILPDVKDWDTLINIAKITYNAYTLEENEDWYDLGDDYKRRDSFGWDSDGIRGHVFGDESNDMIVIALKGTSMGFKAGPTVPKDKINDNLLFSCCCATVDRTWKPVCSCNTQNYDCDLTCVQESIDHEDMYYNIAMSLFFHVQSEYPKAKIWLTGHSLGGSLSSLLGITFGLPAVGFEAPGERLAAKRLHLPSPPGSPYEDMNIWHIGHSADPIFMGVCNGISSSCYIGGYALETKCHLGVTCLFDSVEKLNWKVSIQNHRIKSVIEDVLNKWEWEFPECKPETECVDCGLWNYI